MEAEALLRFFIADSKEFLSVNDPLIAVKLFLLMSWFISPEPFWILPSKNEEGGTWVNDDKFNCFGFSIWSFLSCEFEPCYLTLSTLLKMGESPFFLKELNVKF